MPDSQKDFHKKLLGRRGEKLAADEIKKSGYRLVKRKGDETVFVEVKTRSNEVFGTPREAVGYKKQEKYRNIAEYYFADKGGSDGKNVSFAVAEVTPGGVSVIYNAF